MTNTFGHNFRITTFGESHGPALGVIIDGLPAGLKISLQDIQRDLDRRRPGSTIYGTKRNEPDALEILSGITRDKVSNGAPLAMLVRNTNAKSGDYDDIAQKFRPGHADWTYYVKYGLKPQPGGGRSSGRETVARVAAGAVARALLRPLGIRAEAYAVAVGRVKAESVDPEFAERDPLRFADPFLAPEAHREVEEAISRGDSVGAVVELTVSGVPAGWGEPVFGKVEAALGAALFSIGAVRAVEIGEGIAMSAMRGSAANDPIGEDGPATNRHGGILGGVTTGLPLVARLYIKPTPSISVEQKSVTVDGRPTIITTGGRHDPCLAPRLAPVAEAMALICLADFYLAPISAI